MAQHTIEENTSQASAAVFQQFVNLDWNDPSVLNESYLVHRQLQTKMKGWTKLMILLFVSNENEYEVYVKSLSNVKEEVNRKAEYGFTALMIAVCHGLTSKCKILISNGANVNATTDWNSTASMFCVELLDSTSNFHTFKVLIDSGADLNLTTNNDNSALSYAVKTSNVKAVEYLFAHNIKLPEKLYVIDEAGAKSGRWLFQMHILPLKSWYTEPNFYIGELVLKHAPLAVTQDLLGHVCHAICDTPDDYIVDVRGLEVLIERGAYLTPEILAIQCDLLKNLFLQAYSSVHDRQRNQLQENNIMKSIIREFGNSQESLIFATTLCYLNCCACCTSCSLLH